MYNTWESRDGLKTVSRDWCNSGAICPTGRERTSKVVASLVGYDSVKDEGSKCILQGMEKGYIAKDAIIYGIEHNPVWARKIQEHADREGINMTVFNCDMRDFVAPRKLDLLSGDFMQTAQPWIGEWASTKGVSQLKSKGSAMAINVNSQHAKALAEYDSRVREYWANKEYWDALWMPRLQAGKFDPINIKPCKPFTGVFEEDVMSCLTSFIGIHLYMRDTDMTYKGCFHYYEAPQKLDGSHGGVQKMISFRYERPNR